MPKLAEMTWKEVAALDLERTVALLPVGALEAHGPHLPLATDGIIAEAMTGSAARRLSSRDLVPVELPCFPYTSAGFAAAFPGTLSLQPETVTALLVDLGRSLAAGGVRYLALANAHLDPAHLASLHAAVARMSDESGLRLAFPDLTRKPWASRLTAEFKSGACHGGQFEGSIVLAARPDLVRDLHRSLPPNPVSLSQAIRRGETSFVEAGGPEAYFGDPAAATPEEGRETVEILGGILEDAVLDLLGDRF
jgi:creatinine amidohydrolase